MHWGRAAMGTERRHHRDTASANGQPVAVSVRNLVAGYGGAPVLSRVSLDIPAGQMVTVVGPNGAGKSTLFKILVGILAPLGGEVRILGDTPERARARGGIAYMPQHEQIDWDFPVSVQDVVMSARFGRMRAVGGWRRFLPPSLAPAEHRQAALDALRAVAMSGYAQRAIGALSGGQKKRALLARALAQDAPLLLLDEPLSGVDRASEALIMQVLHKARDEGRTIVNVTHDLISARTHADHVILLNRSVIASGDRDEMLTDEMLARTATAPWVPGPEAVGITGS